MVPFVHGDDVHRDVARDRVVLEPVEDLPAVGVGQAQIERDRVGLVLPRHLDARDRKSTRLNSSHANISYAVFCLKKKKKQIRKSSEDLKQKSITWQWWCDTTDKRHTRVSEKIRDHKRTANRS